MNETPNLLELTESEIHGRHQRSNSLPGLRSWAEADRRRLHGLDAHDGCWLCDQGLKTADHHIGEP